MSGETDCPRFGRLIRGCRFEARYDQTIQRRGIGLADDNFWTSVTTPAGQKPAYPTDRTTYVHDVCVRCGRTVKRPAAP